MFYILVEIEQMLDDTNLDSYPCSAYDWPWDETDALEKNTHIWGHGLSTSGGYSEYIYKYAAKELFDVELSTVEFKNLR